jgi:hypothetical protein
MCETLRLRIRRTYRASVRLFTFVPREQASKFQRNTTELMTFVINLNPNKTITDNDVGDTELSSTNDNQIFPMCENTLSMCQENIYKNDSEYHLDSNDEFKIEANKRFKKSNKVKANTIVN